MKIFKIIFLSLVCSAALAQTPQLVNDANPFSEPANLSPTGAVELNGKLLLSARTSRADGFELHAIDITTGITEKLKEIGPGSISGFTAGSQNIVRLGNKAYFSGKPTNATIDNELWETDGTPANTKKVAFSNIPLVADYSSRVTNLTAVDDGAGYLRLVFSAVGKLNGVGDIGRELHIYNPTDGTLEARDIWLGTGDGSPTDITFFNPGAPILPAILFAANDGLTGAEPWRLQFPTLTLTQVGDVRPGASGSSPTDFVFLKDAAPPKIIFFANDGVTGKEPYYATFPGVFGLINDINPGFSSSNPFSLTQLNDAKAVFSANDGTNGAEVWVTDGTNAGTSLLADIRPGGNSSSPSGFTRIGSKVVFSASESNSKREPWVTDGLPAGTFKLKNINSSLSSGSDPTSYRLLNNKIFFTAFSETLGLEVWKTDGTTAGTELAADLMPGMDSSEAKFLGLVNNRYIVQSQVGNPGSVHAIDDSGSETAGLLPILEGEGSDGWGLQPVGNNGDVIFGGTDRFFGYELYKISNGMGATVIGDIRPGREGVHFNKGITLPNGLAIFIGQDDTHEREPWVTDGTLNGTKLLKDICPGNCSSNLVVEDLILFKGLAFFRAYDGTSYELWQSDGTTAGTKKVTNLNGAGGSAESGPYAVINDKLFFRAYTSATGDELFVTDGTAAGTTLVKDIRPGSNDSSIEFLTHFDGYVFFRASDGTGGTGLWRSDGTAAGTVRVGTLESPEHITLAGNKLFINLYDPATGSELYVLNSPLGTPQLVKDIYPGADSGFPLNIGALGNGKVAFTAESPDYGRELWVSDGTAAGTFLLFDSYPGTDSGSYDLLGIADGYAMYNASDPNLGNELLVTNGTISGTKLYDLRTGSESSSPYDGLYHFGTFYFFANDGVHGYEPWKIVFDQCPMDSKKKEPGVCGCGVPDQDLNNNGILDCLGDEEQEFSKAVLKQHATDLELLVKKIKFIDARASKKKIKRTKVARKQARESLSELLAYAKGAGASVQINSTNQSIQAYLSSEAIEKKVKQAFKFKNLKFKKRKRVARKSLKKLIESL